MRHRVLCSAAFAVFFSATASAVIPIPYTKDPTFNSGRYYADAFASSTANDYQARKLVRLDNGDVVVAGVVPDLRGGNQGGLGLVRYNAAGQRVAWGAPGDAGWNANQYVVFDAQGFTPRPIDDVKAIKLFGSRLFVLVESQAYTLSNTIPPHPSFAGWAADVLVFDLNGAFLGETNVAESDGSASARDLFAGGIVVYEDNIAIFGGPVSMVFGGYQLDNGVAKPVFHRFTVNTDSTFTEKTAQLFVLPGERCVSGCQIDGVALGGRASLSGPPRIYFGGSFKLGQQWDFLAMRVSASGAPDTAFGDLGTAYEGFDLAGSGRNDYGRDIAVVQATVGTPGDRIVIGGDVDGQCGDGIGLLRFDQDGNIDTTFGLGGTGKIYFGDTASTGFCVIPSTSNYTHAIAVQDDRIAIAGERVTGASFGSSAESTVDAMLAIVRSDGGSVFNFDKFPFSDSGTTRSRQSTLWGVTPAGNGAFAATGEARYFGTPSDPGAIQFSTTRFAPLVDAIFADGFD